MRATAWDDVWTGPVREGSEGDIYIKWRVEGTEGLAWGTIGWPFYPTPTPSTITLHDQAPAGLPARSRAGRRSGSRTPSRARWARCSTPCNGGENVLSGDDNLRTMALVEAGYRSLDEKRVVRVDEIHPA